MVLKIGDCQHLANIGEEVGVGEFNPLGYALGAARKEDDGGVVRSGVDIRWSGAEGDDHGGGQFSQGGDVRLDVFEVEQPYACFLERGNIDAGFFKEVSRRDDLFETSEPGALRQRGGPGSEVQDGGDTSGGPEAEQHDGGGSDAGQHDTNAVAIGFVELSTPH